MTSLTLLLSDVLIKELNLIKLIKDLHDTKHLAKPVNFSQQSIPLLWQCHISNFMHTNSIGMCMNYQRKNVTEQSSNWKS